MCRTYPCSRNRSINRYYNPSTDQFLSVDAMVDQTGQPYVFVNDNLLNATDPSGLCGQRSCGIQYQTVRSTSCSIYAAGQNPGSGHPSNVPVRLCNYGRANCRLRLPLIQGQFVSQYNLPAVHACHCQRRQNNCQLPQI